jgi:electron transfer flavoprotein-quinone oxidoreductase
VLGSVFSELFPSSGRKPRWRRVQRHVISLLSKSSVSIDFNTGASDHPESAGYTVLRAKFDRWFAQKVEEAGGMVITGSRADDLVMENGHVAGIVAGGDKIAAKVVIAADGVNSLLADKRGWGEPHLTTSTRCRDNQVAASNDRVVQHQHRWRGRHTFWASRAGSTVAVSCTPIGKTFRWAWWSN